MIFACPITKACVPKTRLCFRKSRRLAAALITCVLSSCANPELDPSQQTGGNETTAAAVPAPAPPPPPPPGNVVHMIENNNVVYASRRFSTTPGAENHLYSGYAVIAFATAPSGAQYNRAIAICEGFIAALNDVEEVILNNRTRNVQVATVWPVRHGFTTQGPIAAKNDCATAVNSYNLFEGQKALREAHSFFYSRRQNDVAERILTARGPFLLAWTPGSEKGGTHSDVLMLAFDLSNISTVADAEESFQAWAYSIERNPDLWLENEIANQTWASAIIQFANRIGENFDFYQKQAGG